MLDNILEVIKYSNLQIHPLGVKLPSHTSVIVEFLIKSSATYSCVHNDFIGKILINQGCEHLSKIDLCPLSERVTDKEPITLLYAIICIRQLIDAVALTVRAIKALILIIIKETVQKWFIEVELVMQRVQIRYILYTSELLEQQFCMVSNT